MTKTLKTAGEVVIELVRKGEVTPEDAVKLAEKLNAQLPKVKRTYIPPSTEDLKGRYQGDVALRRQAVKSEIPFIHRAHMDTIKLYPGFIIFGGVSGTGKSTSAGNILAGFCEYSDRQAFLMTNEDSMADAYDRTACCIERVDFKKYRNLKLDDRTMDRVEARSKQLMHRIIIEGGGESYDMTCLEDVQAVLIHIAENQKYGLAMLDYLQTVTWSRENEDLEPVQVSKKLGFFLKEYVRKVPIPVVVFVQLRPAVKDDADFKSRVQNDRSIYDHAFVAIEAKPDYENRTTKFYCHKDRFWNGMNQEIEMRYEGGMFVPMHGEGI